MQAKPREAKNMKESTIDYLGLKLSCKYRYANSIRFISVGNDQKLGWKLEGALSATNPLLDSLEEITGYQQSGTDPGSRSQPKLGMPRCQTTYPNRR